MIHRALGRMWYWCKETNISLKQNRESRDIPTPTRTTDFPQRCKGNSVEKKIIFSTNGSEQVGIHMHKNELQYVSHTICKNELKIDDRSKCKI